MKIKKLTALILAAMFFVGAFSACTGDSKPQADKISVVCTIFPQYDFVRQIAGDRVNLTLLLPPGVESHSYDPTSADILAVNRADLFIRIGEGMETWSGKIIDAIETSKVTVLDISERLGMTLFNHEAEEHGENRPAGAVDPHVWTSPVIARKIASCIRDELIALDPDNESVYTANALRFDNELASLDSDIRRTVSKAKRAEIVFGSRFALKNFADEYGLSFLAAFDSCAEETEPSAIALAEIIKKIERDKLPVIFYEELIQPKTAKIIAEQLHVKMLLFHSCHNLSADDMTAGKTYLSIMRENLQNLSEALN